MVGGDRHHGIESEVLIVVRQTEALARWAPRVIFVVLWLFPIAIGLIGGGVGNAVVMGIVMGLTAPLCTRVIEVPLIELLRTTRYRKIARELDACLFLAGPVFELRHVWERPLPGALAVTLEHDILLLDSTTNYRLVRLSTTSIVDVVLLRGVAAVGMRYRMPRTGLFRTAIIGFGSDAGAAEKLRFKMLSLIRKGEFRRTAREEDEMESG